jgi:hypothetical protein
MAVLPILIREWTQIGLTEEMFNSITAYSFGLGFLFAQGRAPFLLTFWAASKEFHPVTRNREAGLPGDLIHQVRRNADVNGHHLTASFTGEMVMMRAWDNRMIALSTINKTDAIEKSQLGQDFDGTKDRGTTNPRGLLLDAMPERLTGKIFAIACPRRNLLYQSLPRARHS